MSDGESDATSGAGYQGDLTVEAVIFFEFG
jgi:hypothetical protein